MTTIGPIYPECRCPQIHPAPRGTNGCHGDQVLHTPPPAQLQSRTINNGQISNSIRPETGSIQPHTGSIHSQTGP